MTIHEKYILPDRSLDRLQILAPWLKLVMGIGWVVLFMYVIGPFILRAPGFSSMSGFIEKRDIKATALYYTDIDEFAEAEITLRHSFKYHEDKLTADNHVQ